MNAPANIYAPEPVVVDASPRERAYAATIAIHCPGCDEMEMAARCDMAAMRDAACVGMNRASESAATLLNEVSRMAQATVYAPVPFRQLLRVLGVMKLTMMAAREIERVQRDG